MADEDDLNSSGTEGYKKPKEATLEQMKDLDQNDEALKKWKESLLKGSEAGKETILSTPLLLATAATATGGGGGFWEFLGFELGGISRDLSTP